VEKQVVAIMMTKGQLTSLETFPMWNECDDWWERLADITEVSPVWLKENLGSLPTVIRSIERFKAGVVGEVLEPTLLLVYPVSQEKSGEIKTFPIEDAPGSQPAA
jgi:hypothetical protein